MKQPTPILLIVNPSFNIGSKIALWGLGNGHQLAHSLPLNIYKRLNTKSCKRVLNGDNDFMTDFGSDYQMFKEIIGIAPIKGLRI